MHTFAQTLTWRQALFHVKDVFINTNLAVDARFINDVPCVLQVLWSSLSSLAVIAWCYWWFHFSCFNTLKLTFLATAHFLALPSPSSPLKCALREALTVTFSQLTSFWSIWQNSDIKWQSDLSNLLKLFLFMHGAKWIVFEEYRLESDWLAWEIFHSFILELLVRLSVKPHTKT